MENNYQLLYIEPTNTEIKNIKELIKKQGEKTCNDQLSVQTISDKLSSFTFGWVTGTLKAQLGRRSIKNITLTSFVLCTYTQIEPEYLTIEIICSSIKTGTFLMELVQEKARSMNIKRLQVYSLAITGLKRWYESIGFVYVSTIDLKPGVPKVYRMIKNI